MPVDATRRAVGAVLAQGLRDDLACSVVGVELGAMLQSALTADIADGASPSELLEAMRDACDQAARPLCADARARSHGRPQRGTAADRPSRDRPGARRARAARAATAAVGTPAPLSITEISSRQT